METYILYKPKTDLNLVQSREFVTLERVLESKEVPYEVKEWGHTFDQVTCEYTPTIRVYEDKRFVDYTVDYFNTFDKIKAGHFKEI